ncbi:hypothetical protein D3C75_1193280 [compost metagenome]
MGLPGGAGAFEEDCIDLSTQQADQFQIASFDPLRADRRAVHGTDLWIAERALITVVHQLHIADLQAFE